MLPETNQITSVDMATVVPNDLTGYTEHSYILDRFSLEYVCVGHYLQVGQMNQVEGWILHLSAVLPRVNDLLEKAIPILVEEEVPFKIARNHEIAKALLFGYLGYPLMGKLITVYPACPDRAVQVARHLIRATRGLEGPAIPTDYNLAGVVYTRYGAFNPMIFMDAQGNPTRYIHDGKGQIIKDEYQIPFKQVPGVRWPFKHIRPYAKKKDKWLMKGQYRPMGVIKNDAKGRVLKVFDFGKWYSPRLCIIKEGIAFMNADEAGRDMFDRIRWQYKLHKALDNVLSMPKTFDMFEEAGNIYLVVEFVEGMPLSDVINGMFSGCHWSDLTPVKQYALAACLQMIVEGLEKMHAQGYFHRDLNPRNFLIRPDGTPVFIDLELVYSYIEDYPNPPFVLGTYGYMSPEQIRVSTPTAAQDVYGIGGLMVRVFTSLSPKLFGTDNPEKLFTNLQFLTGNSYLASFACACLSPQPQERPTLARTREFLTDWAISLDKGHVPAPEPSIAPDEDQIKGIIERSIAALGTSRMATEEGIWHSKTVKDKKFISNESLETTYYPGLHTGVGGVLYLLSLAHAAGYQISEPCKQLFVRNWEYFDNIQNQLAANPIPGLFNGSPGAAVASIKAIQAGIFQPSQEMLERLTRGLFVETPDLGIATGLAGHGLAIIQCKQLLQPRQAIESVIQIIHRLANCQEKDGSWLIPVAGVGRSGVKLTGLHQGIAGIVYFLLAAYQFSGESLALTSAVKALDFLESIATKEGEKVSWPVYPKGPSAEGWLDFGATGIALAFIRAYAVTGKDKYKVIADASLKMHPEHIISPYMGISTGLAGIGEVYLEAWNAFKDSYWHARAGWIVQLLLHTNQLSADNTSFWITDNSTLPTADLMTGNAGVIHFLMYYLQPDKFTIPVFN